MQPDLDVHITEGLARCKPPSVTTGLDEVEALRNRFRVEGYPRTVAGIAPGLVEQVAHHLVAGLDTDLVQEPLDGVPNLGNDAGIQQGGVV